eukprot:scaffold28459_cov107-Isochrysis_galbana.AAC.1
MKERREVLPACSKITNACSSQQSFAPQSARVQRVAASAAYSLSCPSPGARSSLISPMHVESDSQHSTAEPVWRSAGSAPSPGSSSSAACTSASEILPNIPPAAPPPLPPAAGPSRDSRSTRRARLACRVAKRRPCRLKLASTAAAPPATASSESVSIIFESSDEVSAETDARRRRCRQPELELGIGVAQLRGRRSLFCFRAQPGWRRRGEARGAGSRGRMGAVAGEPADGFKSKHKAKLPQIVSVRLRVDRAIERTLIPAASSPFLALAQPARGRSYTPGARPLRLTHYVHAACSDAEGWQRLAAQ